MKSNEIIQEGPLDFLKKVGGGVSGTFGGPGFASGYKAAQSSIAARDVIKSTADRMFQDWSNVIQGAKAANQPLTQDNLKNWADKRFGGVRTSLPNKLDNNSVYNFIKAEIGAKQAGTVLMDVKTWMDLYNKLDPADQQNLKTALGVTP